MERSIRSVIFCTVQSEGCRQRLKLLGGKVQEIWLRSSHRQSEMRSVKSQLREVGSVRVGSLSIWSSDFRRLNGDRRKFWGHAATAIGG